MLTEISLVENKYLKDCVRQIAKAKITKDVVAVYLISQKYKIDLLALLALYEVYGKDLFLFFYILGSGNSNACYVGKNLEDLELSNHIKELPKESNLKLIFSKAKKVSDALRRNSDRELSSATLPIYNAIKEKCVYSKETGEHYLNFYSEIFKEPKKETKKKVKNTEKKDKSNVL